MKAIILAGGGGTRLWPLSRESFPKQFLRLGDQLSLLQKTILRLEKVDTIDTILISTNLSYSHLVEQQVQEIKSKKSHLFLEPLRKNTAPAIALAVTYLEENHFLSPSEPILVLPSDHLINPESAFIESIQNMAQRTENHKIITFGITPQKPETGYGYIQIREPYDKYCYCVDRFIEKPNIQTAIKLIQDPHFLWNSGMFMFNSQTFWAELKIHCSQIFLEASKGYQMFLKNFSNQPDLSIDYAVMEKSENIVCCPLMLTWSDIGSWDSLYDVLTKDENQNVKIGEVLDVDTKNCLIFGNKRLITTIGLEDMIIIETEDALFISKRGESQKVKNLVKTLLEKGKKEGTEHPNSPLQTGL